MSHSAIAFIIGGSSGMGLATAKQLVAQGVDIIILGNNVDKLDKAKSEPGANAKNNAKNNAKIEALKANLYDQSDVERIIGTIANEQRHIKYLVNAAGYFNPKPFLEHTVEDYAAYMDL